MTGMRPVRLGVFATGTIAHAFAEVLRLILDDAELVAVGSRSTETARRFADRHGTAPHPPTPTAPGRISPTIRI